MILVFFFGILLNGFRLLATKRSNNAIVTYYCFSIKRILSDCEGPAELLSNYRPHTVNIYVWYLLSHLE